MKYDKEAMIDDIVEYLAKNANMQTLIEYYSNTQRDNLESETDEYVLKALEDWTELNKENYKLKDD